jgi:hypothetical protein
MSGVGDKEPMEKNFLPTAINCFGPSPKLRISKKN